MFFASMTSTNHGSRFQMMMNKHGWNHRIHDVMCSLMIHGQNNWNQQWLYGATKISISPPHRDQLCSDLTIHQSAQDLPWQPPSGADGSSTVPVPPSQWLGPTVGDNMELVMVHPSSSSDPKWSAKRCWCLCFDHRLLDLSDHWNSSQSDSTSALVHNPPARSFSNSACSLSACCFKEALSLRIAGGISRIAKLLSSLPLLFLTEWSSLDDRFFDATSHECFLRSFCFLMFRVCPRSKPLAQMVQPPENKKPFPSWQQPFVGRDTLLQDP